MNTPLVAGFFIRGRMGGMSTDAVDAKLIIELRRRTGMPVLKCKQTLIDAGGDIDAATKFLMSVGVVRFNLSALRKEAEKLRNQRGNPGSG
jgi:translation elongation factor EF-Ts